MTDSLSLTVWMDRSSFRPDVPGRAHVVIELEGTGVPTAGARPPSTTMLALDVSGSMQGTPIEQVVRSVDGLLDGLSPTDRVGVVAFSSGATLVVPPTAVDSAGKKLVRSRVSRLFAEGQTDMEAGLVLAAETLGAPDAARRHGVILLSDGVPNQGAATADALREVVQRFRHGISFSSLGYGVKHDEDILGAIGDAGGGGYAFIPDPATCSRAFAQALGAQADVVASGVELTLSPAAGVEVMRLLGSLPMRFGLPGITIALPDLASGGRRLVVAEVAVAPPGDDRFLLAIADVRASWREPGKAEVFTQRRSVTAEIAAREPAVIDAAVRRLMLVRTDDTRAEARGLADRSSFGSAAIVLRALLAEMARIPGFVVGEASPLGEAYELVLDEAMAMERNPGAEAYEMFRKSAMESKLAEAKPPPSSRGVLSTQLLESSAGHYPKAELIVLTGPNAGQRRALDAECVIGRTATADLAIPSASISRRHAEVFALDGKFWIRDYGSTNTTLVNGKPVRVSPETLRSGDVVRIGAVEIRYEESKD